MCLAAGCLNAEAIELTNGFTVGHSHRASSQGPAALDVSNPFGHGCDAKTRLASTREIGYWPRVGRMSRPRWRCARRRTALRVGIAMAWTRVRGTVAGVVTLLAS